MRNEQNQIKEFMIKAGQECPASPKIPSREVIELRVKLIAEELLEFCEAVGAILEISDGEVNVAVLPDYPVDLVGAYDGLIDIAVVDIGAVNAFGFDMEPGWQEVHRSNMSKFIDGHRRDDGKWIKGPSYSPAALQPILEQQGIMTEGMTDDQLRIACAKAIGCQPHSTANGANWIMPNGEILPAPPPLDLNTMHQVEGKLLTTNDEWEKYSTKLMIILRDSDYSLNESNIASRYKTVHATARQRGEGLIAMGKIRVSWPH